ncbi:MULTISPECIES: hypothetical protein [Butyricimonas]|uniref:hypothetical protein n=1 Tax=Butyricimonas TaxID=574697 RepID=UPI001D07D928|nr:MULTISPECIES: hypothetical protein [Butyricimonas]MCB6973517.1 hypothetical protein [Butyricimonas synergistica]MCG4520379.1 hypothetical protein [Butyricimonas sp. DFI.6.44]
MDKRNKLWRHRQMARVFKARMILYAAYRHCIIHEDGSIDSHPHWFELAKEKWARVYKTSGTPCNCSMCRGEKYNRKEYKKETLRIIKESLD